MTLKWPEIKSKPLKHFLQKGLDLLYPPHCAGCGVKGTVICCDCLSQFMRVAHPLCLSGKDIYEMCGARQESAMIVLSDAWYLPPVSSAVLCLKYRPDRRLGAALGVRLAVLVMERQVDADMVVVIPLGRQRFRQRGYNQVDLLARPFSRELGLPFTREALLRTRETGSQVGLCMEERRDNVRDAFRADHHQVEDKQILLLDDVVTTGSTLLSAAGALFRAGARQVTGVTVARALSQSIR